MAVLTGVGRRVRRFLTGLSIREVVDFPEEPVKGMPIIRGDIFYICRLIGGMLVWSPVAGGKDKAIFNQTVDSDVWEFYHTLGEHVVASAYDANGKMLRIYKLTNLVDADLNKYLIRVSLSTISSGSLAIFAVSSNASDIEIADIEVMAGDIDSKARSAEIDIDEQAEQQRQRILTSGSGQMLEYAATTDEVKRYKDDPAPVDTDYPYLMADVGILGTTLSEVATAVDAIDKEWRVVGSKIKHTRRLAKGRVRAAKDVGDYTAIEDAKNIDWSVIFT